MTAGWCATDPEAAVRGGSSAVITSTDDAGHADHLLGLSPAVPRSRLGKRGPSGLQACDGDAERRAGDVVQSRGVEEVDGFGIAPVTPSGSDTTGFP